MANCANCGGPMRVDRARGTLVCDHCGAETDAPALLSYLEFLDDSASRCPACATPLSNSRIDGLALLACRRCEGLLVDMRTFTAVIDAVRLHEARTIWSVAPRGQRAGDRTVTCPLCRQPMLAHVYGGPGNVVIDTCERCLVNWLDAGELRRIALAPDRLEDA
jgi:Zn-finger nucleic acid-binding protein